MKQAYSPEWHDVFLSHTRADREQAEQLAEQLRAAGLSVYLDVDDEALSRLHGRELAGAGGDREQRFISYVLFIRRCGRGGPSDTAGCFHPS